MADAKLSRQNIKILMAIGEEITTLKDVKVNGTSIVDLDIAFCYTKGSATQPVIPGLEKIVSSTTTDFDLEKTIPTNTGITYVVPRQTNNKTATNLEIGFYFPNGLYHQNSNGTRDLTTFEAELWIRISGSTWHKYEKNIKIELNSVVSARISVELLRPSYIPDGSDWEVKVIRLTEPSDLVGSEGDAIVSFSKVNFTVMEDTTLNDYPGTAILGIWIEDVGIINNAWPEISCLIDGMQFFMPPFDHYNETTRQYSDVIPWDGTLDRKAFTTNLSYIMYSFLGDKLIKTLPINEDGSLTRTFKLGLGVSEDEIGIYSFYQFAKYCDQTLLGHPRYTLSKQFIERMSFKQFTDILLSIGNARLVRKYGLLCVVWDRKLTTTELEAVPIVSIENTLEGFKEATNDISERFTHVVTVFEDSTNGNTVASVNVDSGELVDFLKAAALLPTDTDINYFVDKYNYNSTTIELVGATSYVTALIKARSTLFDLLWGYRTISFSGGYELSNFYEGQVIGIVNTSLIKAKKSSKLKYFTDLGAGSYVLTLSTPITLTPTSYIYVYIKNDTQFITEELTATDTFLQLTPVKIQPHTSNFVIGETEKTSKEWTVVLSAEPILTTAVVVADPTITYWTIIKIDFSDNIFTFQAKQFFNEKFDFIDGGSYDYTPSNQVLETLPGVSNVLTDFYLKSGLSSAQLTADISWQHVVPASIATQLSVIYEVKLTVFTSYTKTVKIERQYKEYPVSAQDLLNPLTTQQEQLAVLNTTNITQVYSTQIDFTIENFLDFFSKNDISLTEIQGEFILEITAYTANIDLQIANSPTVLVKDTITLTRPPITETDFLLISKDGQTWS